MTIWSLIRVLVKTFGVGTRFDESGTDVATERATERASGHATGPAPQATSRIAVTRRTLADVRAEAVHWLWPGRIPFGKLTVLEGDPGLGKSTLAVEVAARVSTGTPLPGGESGEPGDVLFITFEDGVGDTIKPRLTVAGGDDRRVHVLDGVAYDGQPARPFTFPGDIDALAQEVEATRAKLVVIDPLSAVLNTIDSYKEADVRQVLARLAHLAERLGVAIILIRHYTKRGGRNAVTAGAGSIGITGAARVVLAVHRDPRDGSRRVLAVAKCNLACTAESLAFRLDDADAHPCVRWDGTSPLTADQLVAARTADAGESGDDRLLPNQSADFLRHYLARGPAPKPAVMAAGKQHGHAERTLERLAARLGIVSTPTGFGTPVLWSLPPGLENPSSASSATLRLRGETGGSGGTGEDGGDGRRGGMTESDAA